jgi:type I restriction enzyme S subunit
MTQELSGLCCFADGRVAVAGLGLDTYISTENMLPNKEGITRSAGLPSVAQVQAYQAEDVLVSNIRPYFRKIWLADRDGGCSNDILVLRAREGCNPVFLYYLLSDDNFFDYATATAKGTKMPRGDKDAIMQYEVPDLPLGIQIGIGEVLSVFDARIAENKKINHHLEQVAQAIFKSWFVDFEPFGGVMPDDWREGTLSEIANITMGQSPDGTSYNEDSIGTVFYQGRAEFGSRYPTRRLFTTQPKRMAVKGDVLMSVRAPVGDLNVAFESCCLGRGLATIQSNNDAQSFILYTMFALKQTLDIFNGEGTVFGSINKNDMANLPVPIPSDEVIRQFEELVRPMDTAIEANYTENCHLQAARDSLLPRLMSGELSVADIGNVK